MHSESVHTTKHDQIEQHISKKSKIHVKTHKIIILGYFHRDFCKYCYVIKDWLLKIGPNRLQVQFSPGFLSVHRTGPANTNLDKSHGMQYVLGENQPQQHQ